MNATARPEPLGAERRGLSSHSLCSGFPRTKQKSCMGGSKEPPNSCGCGHLHLLPWDPRLLSLGPGMPYPVPGQLLLWPCPTWMVIEPPRTQADGARAESMSETLPHAIREGASRTRHPSRVSPCELQQVGWGLGGSAQLEWGLN